MFSKLKKTRIVLALISVLISGCASHEALKQPIAKGGRIGVISNFRDTALFQRVGTTSVDNASFYRWIPGLRMNALLTTTVANELYRSHQFRVIPIYHPTAIDLLSARVSKKGVITTQYRDFISRLIRGKNLSTVVLVTPGDIDFGDGQYIGAIWWASGYGLFNRAFIFMQTSTVFAAYNVYVIDVKTSKVLARATGDLQKRAHDINIAWHKGYSGVTPRTLKIINKIIRKQMPSSLTRVVRKTGLP